uniref:Cadherin domain-containing protein n=1 Tax=Timema shepardi TaxID=629360 RepID=A0A7R9ARS2_TIMSH|nr:unnamed protein product [Timema shepardi]
MDFIVRNNNSSISSAGSFQGIELGSEYKYEVLYFLQELDGDDDLFSVSTVNGKGVIRLTGQLDYERKFIYQLRVLAVDRANNNRVNTGTAAIVVKVQDVEDQPPEFVVASPVTRVSEDAAIGTPVLQVKAVDGDRGINNRIVYSITQGSQGSFEIDADSGVVFTQQKLDRESSTNNNGAYILEITAQEETQSTFPPPIVKTEVTVIVTDVNDEIPTFRSPSYIGVINENAQVNTPVAFLDGAVPEVFDHDQGTNGTFVMFIDGDHGVFDVTPHKGVNEASFLIRVKDSSKLDFEKVSTDDFRTSIIDSALKYEQRMTLSMGRFLDSSVVSVLENSNAGTTVAWVQAMDEDSGNFGTQGIRYINLGGSVSDLLYLNPNTGVITIKSIEPAFDRELMSRHYLTVEARDDSGDGLAFVASPVSPTILISGDTDTRVGEPSTAARTLVPREGHGVDPGGRFLVGGGCSPRRGRGEPGGGLLGGTGGGVGLSGSVTSRNNFGDTVVCEISRVNEQLQHKDMTVDRAVSHLTGLKDALQDIRDTGIDVILDEASNICAATSLGIDCFFEEKRVKKRKRLTLEESIQYDDTINCSVMTGRKGGGCGEGAPMLLFAPGANYSSYGPAPDTGNTAQLIINVEDVNDNAPQFLHSKYEAHLLENKLEFESLLVIEARDLDLNASEEELVKGSLIYNMWGGRYQKLGKIKMTFREAYLQGRNSTWRCGDSLRQDYPTRVENR